MGLRELFGVVAGIVACSAASPIVFTPVSSYTAFINGTIDSYIPPQSVS